MSSTLFLVNRRFYEYGTEIFYSRNRFEVVWDTSSNREEADNFIGMLISLPPSALPYIRFIDIYLVGVMYRHFGNDHPFECSWDEAIKLLTRRLSLSELTLRVEDVTGRGHRSRHIESRERRSLFIPLE